MTQGDKDEQQNQNLSGSTAVADKTTQIKTLPPRLSLKRLHIQLKEDLARSK